MSDADATHGLERVGEAVTLVEELGPIPCPTPGCQGTGSRIRLVGRTEIDNVCSACATRLDRERKQEERREEAALLLSRSGATRLMQQWTLDSFPQSDPVGAAAVRQAKGWLARYLETDPRRDQVENLFLFGSVGSGKTGLAWAILRSLIEEHLIGGRFVIFPDLLALQREAYDHHVPFDAYTMIARAPVLVVDDVGAERPTEWAREQLLTLVDRRFQRNLPTIYTSNYEPHVLGERLGRGDIALGDRIVSRMVGRAVQIRLDRHDLRMA